MLGLAVVALVACGDKPATETGAAPTGTTTADSALDSAASEEPVWEDLRLASSVSFNGVVGTTTDAWAVGTSGEIWRVALGGEATPVATGVVEDLFAVYGEGKGDGVVMTVVGTSGAVLDLGSGPPVAEDLGTVNLYGISGQPDDLTAVGWGGVVRRQGGGDWEFESTPAGLQLNAVWVDADGAAASVGNGGVIANRVDGVWSLSVSPTTRDIYAIAGTGDDLWAFGVDGLVLRRQLNSWQLVEVDTSQTLWGAWAAPTGEVFAVGNGGTALRFDGTGLFEELVTGVDSNLYAVHGVSASQVWAVGNRGQVLRLNE